MLDLASPLILYTNHPPTLGFDIYCSDCLVILYDPPVFDVFHLYKYLQNFPNFIRIVILNDSIFVKLTQKIKSFAIQVLIKFKEF